MGDKYTTRGMKRQAGSNGSMSHSGGTGQSGTEGSRISNAKSNPGVKDPPSNRGHKGDKNRVRR